MKFSITFFLCCLVSLQTAFAVPKQPKYQSVNSATVFKIFDPQGNGFTCAVLHGNWQAGQSKKSDLSKFLPETKSKKITTLKKSIKAKPTKAKKKKLKALLAKAASHTTLCQGGKPTGLTPRLFPLEESDVQYLYEKVALGAVTPEAMQVGLTQGAEALADYVLTPVSDPETDLKAGQWLDGNPNQETGEVTMRGMQLWSLYILLHSKNPFYDRHAFFFLHNLLATSLTVLSPQHFSYMRDHLNLIRAHSITGDYPELLRGIAHDPVMLLWLDGASNNKYNPNENFARELMELFTLSPKNDTGTPNYSETTVQEVAKACTGWRIVITGNEPNTVLETFYDSNFHAPGKKTLFGDKPFSGTADKDIDTIDYIFSSHPHAAVYLARRLAEEYLAPTPPKEIVDALAQVLRDTNFNFKIALKMLFSSDAFFEPQYRNTIIKTPLERIVEVLRRVQMPYDFTSLQVNVEGAGQQISNPPSVFGWNQQDWLTGQWLLNLSNTYTRVVNNDILFNAQSPVWTYAKLLPSPNATVNQVIDTLCDRMNITLNPQQRALLVNYFNTRVTSVGAVVPELWNPANTSQQRRKLAGALEILFRTSDFQMR